MTIVSGTVAARRARLPHVWHFREAPRDGGLRARALRVLSARADAVIGVSTAAARLGGARAVVVPDGYDPPPTYIRPSTRIGASAHRIGVIGRIIPTKSQHVVVDAVARLVDGGTDASLVVVGTTYPGHEAYAAQLVDQVAALGIRDRFHPTGWLDDVRPALHQLDVLVVSTGAGEGFGSVVVEAFAAGVPVVSAATGGIDELVLHERTGFTCPPDEPAALAAAIERLIRDITLRAELIEGARHHGAQFTTERSAAGLLAVWRSAAARWSG